MAAASQGDRLRGLHLMASTDIPIVLDAAPAGRFARFGLIKWWNQSLLRDAQC